MDKLLEQVERGIRARGLFRRGERILVGVSGGVDSMALLHLLDALAPRHGWRLAVAHFNHRLRGRSSDADERLARKSAMKLGWPFVNDHADVRALARRRKISIEMAARTARHDFLARAAARLKIRSIALAHHADDQLELFFLRLFRGSGGEGLSGMKWIAPSPSRLPVAKLQPQLVRPLLGLSKSELEQFAREKKMPFREDASNRRLDIQRNRIRHELLPLLRREYQPALDRTVLRMMEIAGAEAEFVNTMAEQWLAKNGVDGRTPRRKDPCPGGKGFSKWLGRTSFKDLPIAVQRRCVQIQLFRRHIAGGYDLVERLRTSPGRAVTIAPELAVVLASQGGLRLERSGPVRGSGFRPSRDDNRPEAELQMKSGGGQIAFGGLNIRWRIGLRTGAIPPERREGREYFDADAVGSRLTLRHWRPGDRFQPSGMSTPVKLQDLFTNRKIPQKQRHELVVVTTGAGELVWVENLRISERFKLSKRTKRCLQWQWKRL